jgi:hypothetical protein
MGTIPDRLIREQNRRKDDKTTKDKLKEARQVIIKQCYSVNSDGVESRLKPTSLVPAQVRNRLTLPRCVWFILSLERILGPPLPFRLRRVLRCGGRRLARGRDRCLEVSIHTTSPAFRGHREGVG